MPSAPRNPYAERSKPARKLEIRLGPENGDEPTVANVTTRLRNPVCTHNAGGTLDRIEMTYDLGGQGQRIIDTYLKAGFARQVEVVLKSDTKGGKDTLIGWGDIISEKKVLTGGLHGEERVIVVASVMPYHFGTQLMGPVYRRPTGTNDLVVQQTEVVFNPVVNNIVEPNMSTFLSSTDGYAVWVHPDSVRTTTARTNAQDSDAPLSWTLANIIDTLCGHLNASEEFINNPTFADLSTWLADAPEVRDVKLQTGKYLNDYLDDILSAHGYGWRLDYKYVYDPDPDRQVSIVIFAKNTGKEVKLYHQRPFDTVGARFDKSNVVSLDLDTEIASTANQVVAHGGLKQYEITCELYRGWAEADDALTVDLLTQSLSTNIKAHGAPWRLWVLNEAGDYCGLRSTVKPIPSTPFDLTSILGANSIPKRRKAEDCLTHFLDDSDDGSRRRRPVFVEWYTSDNEWKPLPDGWGETVLEDQIGIYFGGDAPPEELWQLGDNARIRITFTVSSDLAITATANKDSNSPTSRTNQLFIDVSDRFVYRGVQTSGPYASVLAGLATADTRDDSTELQTFVDTIRSIEDCAIMRGTAVLFGINTQYQIGQVVTRVKGRDISFNRMATTSKTKRYLQIVGRMFDYNNQATTLMMEPVEESVNKKFAGWVA